MPILPTKGLFIVFEGVDFAGKGEQIKRFRDFVRTSGEVSKYLPLVDDREPTFRADDIIKHLKADDDAFSSAEVMARGYVEDRKEHSVRLQAFLEQGYTIIEDRYRMSTDAFQTAQGMDVKDVLDLQSSGVLTADVTFLFRISLETQHARRASRKLLQGNKKDKFDDAGDTFQGKLIEQYDYFCDLGSKDSSLYGNIVVIDADRTAHEISQDVIAVYKELYEKWIAGLYVPRWAREKEGRL